MPMPGKALIPTIVRERLRHARGTWRTADLAAIASPASRNVRGSSFGSSVRFPTSAEHSFASEASNEFSDGRPRRSPARASRASAPHEALERQLRLKAWGTAKEGEVPIMRYPALVSLCMRMEEPGRVRDAVTWRAPKPCLNVPAGPKMPAKVEGESVEARRAARAAFSAAVHEDALLMQAALLSLADELTVWRPRISSRSGLVPSCRWLASRASALSDLYAACGDPRGPRRMAYAKCKICFDDGALQAAQRAALLAAAELLETARERDRGSGAGDVRELGCACHAALRAHQAAGGLDARAAVACARVVTRAEHCAKLINPKFLRDAKFV